MTHLNPAYRYDAAEGIAGLFDFLPLRQLFSPSRIKLYILLSLP